MSEDLELSIFRQKKMDHPSTHCIRCGMASYAFNHDGLQAAKLFRGDKPPGEVKRSGAVSLEAVPKHNVHYRGASHL